MRFPFEQTGPVLLMIAAVGWYVAVMLATNVFLIRRDSAGARALAAWICNVPVVILAILAGRYEIAIGMIFATSVACMTLVLGIATFAAGTTPHSTHRRAWSMLLPVSLICMLIGLSSGFDRLDAIILLAQGLAMIGLWQESPQSAPPSTGASFGLGRLLALLAVVVIAGAGGFAAVKASSSMSLRMGMTNAGMITALVLAPAMVLPLIGIGLQAAHDGRYDQFVGGLIGFVFLNLCVLLPLATLLWIAQPGRRAEVFDPFPATAPTTTATTGPATTTASSDDDSNSSILPPRVLPYPMAVWRVDTVLLIAVGLLLLPVSLGRWSLGRPEAIGLIGAWVIFMLLTVLTTLIHRL